MAGEEAFSLQQQEGNLVAAGAFPNGEAFSFQRGGEGRFHSGGGVLVEGCFFGCRF